MISLIADTTLEGSPVVAAMLSANATAVSPITASPLELVVTCCPVVVTVSTATPIVLPVGLALVVAPVVLTPVDDTDTVVLDLELVVPLLLLLLDELMEPLPSLPLLEALPAAKAHAG